MGPISAALGPSSLAVAISVLLILFAFAPSRGETLQSAFDAAGTGGGYDKYIELQLGDTLTGGLTIPVSSSACISGNGAILDLQTSSIQIQGKGTVLDIDHCVIINGGNPLAGLSEGALNFVGGEGDIVSNTFYMNTVGIRIYGTSPGLILVKNNIIVLNSQTGLLCQLYHEPQVSYNDCWGNAYGNYLVDCG